MLCYLPAGQGARQRVVATVAGQASSNVLHVSYADPLITSMSIDGGEESMHVSGRTGGCVLTVYGYNLGLHLSVVSIKDTAACCPRRKRSALWDSRNISGPTTLGIHPRAATLQHTLGSACVEVVWTSGSWRKSCVRPPRRVPEGQGAADVE